MKNVLFIALLILVGCSPEDDCGCIKTVWEYSSEGNNQYWTGISQQPVSCTEEVFNVIIDDSHRYDVICE